MERQFHVNLKRTIALSSNQDKWRRGLTQDNEATLAQTYSLVLSAVVTTSLLTRAVDTHIVKHRLIKIRIRSI